MPQIKQYTRQTTGIGFSNVRASQEDFGAAIGRGLEGVGRATEDLSNRMQEIKLKKNALEYSRKISEFKLENLSRQQELSSQEFDLDADISAVYAQDLEERFSQLEIPEGMEEAAQADLQQLKFSFAKTGMEDQIRRSGIRAKTNWENTVQANQNLVSLDPAKREEALRQLEITSQSLPGSPEDRSVFLETAKDSINKSFAGSLAINNPDQFLQDIKDGKYRDIPDLPRYKNAAKRQKEINLKKNQAKLQSQLSEKINDGIAEAQATGFSDQFPSNEEIMFAYGAEKGKEIIRDYEDAKLFGEKITSIATLPQDEVNSLLAQSVPEGEGFAQEQKEFSALQRAASARQKAIDNDAGQYVLSNFPEVQEAYNQYEESKSPSSLQYAIDLNLEKQSELGVPFRKQRVLGRDNATQIVEQMMTVKPQERLEIARNFKEQYGKHWPDVYAELVDADLSDNLAVALRMESPTQRRAQSLLMEADAFEDEITNLVDKDSQTTIEDKINAELSDYISTVSSQPGNAAEIERTVGATTALAIQYVVQDKMNPNKAAQKAAKDIITDQYNFVNRVRIPADFNSDLIEEGMTEALSLIEGNENIDPRIIGSISGTPDDIINEQYRKELKQGGYFITNAQEDGVILFDRNGYTVMVDSDNGLKPFELKFIDLEGLGKSRPREIKSIKEGF